MGLREKLEKKIEEKQEERRKYLEQASHYKSLAVGVEIYVQALEDALRLIPKEPEEGVEATLRPGTMLFKAREILSAKGEPMHIVDLLKALGRPNDNTNRAAVSGSISAYYRKGQVFTRPAPNTFGLVEFPVKAIDTNGKPNTALSGPPPNFGSDERTEKAVEETDIGLELETEIHGLMGVSDRRAEFSELAERWRRETRFSSSSDEQILHPAYQSIMAMGSAAVPLVLEELRERHGHWFWALHFMTGVDPVPEGANIAQARDAWLTWGREKGLLR